MDPIEELKGIPEAERVDWLRNNAGQLDGIQLQQIADYFNAMGNSRGLVELARQLGDNASTVDATAPARAEARAIDENPELDRDGDGRIDQNTATGRAVADELGVPRSITDAEGQFIEAFGGTVESAERALDFINEQYDQGFESISDFVESDMWANVTYKQQVIELFGGEQGGESSWKFNLPRGESHVVTVAEAGRAQEAFGIINPEELNYFVKAAYANDLRDSMGKLNWQISAAFQTFSGYGAGQERDYRSESRKLLLKEADLRRKIEDTQGLPDHLSGRSRLQRELQGVRSQLQKLAADPGRILKPKDLSDRYKRGMELYNSESTAFFHALDEGLAARMAANPGLLDVNDARRALGLMQQAGIKGEDAMAFTETMYDLGFVDPMATAWADAMQKAADQAAGGSQRIRTLPDPVAVRQSAKDFYRQMFLTEPDDATLDRFAASVSDAIMSAEDDEAVDPNARIRQAAEQMPEYQKYYGNKPGGMAEEEYQGMHRAAQGSMLGDELADNQAVRVGMREGSYQTTVGSAAGTKEAWNNSTFLGRLARAAQTVNRNT